MGILIDTSIWVDVERGNVSPEDVAALTGDEPVYISPVTIAELQFGVERARDPEVALKRREALAKLRQRPLLVMDETTGETFGRLAAKLKDAGRGYAFRIQDLWLASQAVQHGFRFLTLNGKDFEDVPELELMIWPGASRSR